MPQLVTEILLHIIFSTKHRQPVLDASLEEDLYGYLRSLCQEFNCPSLAVNGTADHVHLCCRLSQTTTISKLVAFIKDRSAIWMRTQGNTWKDFAWQSGSAVFSIGASLLPSLLKHIRNQKPYHLHKSFQDEYREFLRAYRIEFDETRIWD